MTGLGRWRSGTYASSGIDYYTATDRSPELKELIEARRAYRGEGLRRDW